MFRAHLRPGAALALIAALAVLIRAPFNGNAGVDEAFYLVVGRQWLGGVPPYVGALDVKPPLLFLLMAAAEALFGPTLFAAKALAAAAAAATACGLYLLGRRFFGEFAGFAAALLYSLASLNLGGSFSPAELILAPFITFGVLLGLSAADDGGKTRLLSRFLPGLLFGAAASIKQTAIFEAAALGLWLAWSHRGAIRLRVLAAFAAGLATVPLAFALYYLALGHLGALFDNAVIAALFRMRVGYIPWSEALALLVAGLLPVLPIVAMSGVAWAERRRIPGGARGPLSFIALWTVAALLGVLATKAMFVIYLLPLLQPLCLMAGAFVEFIPARLASAPIRRTARVALLGAATLYAGFALFPLFLAGGESLAAADGAAALMRGAGLKPGDRILVADRDLPVYLAAHADPELPIFHPQHLLCPFPMGGASTALADTLDRDPAFIVVADPPIIRVCEPPERRRLLETKLAQGYCLLGRFDSSVTGWRGGFSVYGLKRRAEARCT